ncbi:TsaC protein (YrdC domain) required for threonylcarbamoyladenosine t(6)A37 modification in tRNA [hydrothermal vent metagenome]|uniref:TsaC protein (YrdC domain) required for threonylcarbamoyladenosine t(6)A37 modification in tRNA n=1 Tax=hydrothermal vent metagenome TaxID=652676 RepID=A0A1W1BSR3_9ZZZZ
MVKCNSTTRLFSLNNKVILTQTDTTVGLLSQDAKKLREIKSRQQTKPFICVFQDFTALKSHSIRIPNRFKRNIRRAKKTTFIVKNRAFRVARSPLHSQLLSKLPWAYSTSANESGKTFQRDFCEQKADIIIENKQGLFESKASKLYKINQKKRKRLR